MPSLSGPSPMRPLARSPVAHAPMNTGGKARSPAKAIVAGSISGAVEAVISYPTEFGTCVCGCMRAAASAWPKNLSCCIRGWFNSVAATDTGAAAAAAATERHNRNR